MIACIDGDTLVAVVGLLVIAAVAIVGMRAL